MLFEEVKVDSIDYMTVNPSEDQIQAGWICGGMCENGMLCGAGCGSGVGGWCGLGCKQ